LEIVEEFRTVVLLIAGDFSTTAILGETLSQFGEPKKGTV
jgi:hypothetical protein